MWFFKKQIPMPQKLDPGCLTAIWAQRIGINYVIKRKTNLAINQKYLMLFLMPTVGEILTE